ncbi:ketosteroid isomerase [Salmonella enterica subsp. enterica serovar 4,12:i:-]|nr:ketosteroid isomerase [Salmonella enterica subsp. enterica serovar 4,12:i:-]
MYHDCLATLGENQHGWVNDPTSAVNLQLNDLIEHIASFGLNFELKHILVSRDNVALSLHNTARRNDLVLDEHLATVCTLRDGKIAAIETYLPDLPGMNAFFARD